MYSKTLFAVAAEGTHFTAPKHNNSNNKNNNNLDTGEGCAQHDIHAIRVDTAILRIAIEMRIDLIIFLLNGIKLQMGMFLKEIKFHFVVVSLINLSTVLSSFREKKLRIKKKNTMSDVNSSSSVVQMNEWLLLLLLISSLPPQNIERVG